LFVLNNFMKRRSMT